MCVPVTARVKATARANRMSWVTCWGHHHHHQSASNYEIRYALGPNVTCRAGVASFPPGSAIKRDFKLGLHLFSKRKWKRFPKMNHSNPASPPSRSTLATGECLFDGHKRQARDPMSLIDRSWKLLFCVCVRERVSL